MDIEKIVIVHNELCSISVKGEDAITMAKCLLTLREFVEEIKLKEEKADGDI